LLFAILAGCNVSRLRDFIVGFYSHGVTNPQVVDDAFCAFVWSIVVEQPTVRVGTVPEGISSEVYIAPQASAKRKAAAKGEVHVDEPPPSLILVENARERSLEDLKAEYGEDVRIAVDAETSLAAITGSHIRVCGHRCPAYSELIVRSLQSSVQWFIALCNSSQEGEKEVLQLLSSGARQSTIRSRAFMSSNNCWNLV
jgi:hypothetical protein